MELIHHESCLVGMKELLSFNSHLILLSSSALFCCPLPHHEAPFWGELECLKKRLSLKRLNFFRYAFITIFKGGEQEGDPALWLTVICVILDVYATHTIESSAGATLHIP